jgi:hypothetical protein
MQADSARARAAQDLEGCTFRPQINERSRRLLERRDAGGSYAHHHLARQMLTDALQQQAVRPPLHQSNPNTSSAVD